MDCMMASILMHLKETIEDCTKDHFAIGRIINDARRLGISVTVLLELGDLVRSDFRLNNCRKEVLNVDENLVQNVSVMLEEIIGLKVSYFLTAFLSWTWLYFFHVLYCYVPPPLLFTVSICVCSSFSYIKSHIIQSETKASIITKQLMAQNDILSKKIDKMTEDTAQIVRMFLNRSIVNSSPSGKSQSVSVKSPLEKIPTLIIESVYFYVYMYVTDNCLHGPLRNTNTIGNIEGNGATSSEREVETMEGSY